MAGPVQRVGRFQTPDTNVYTTLTEINPKMAVCAALMAVAARRRDGRNWEFPFGELTTATASIDPLELSRATTLMLHVGSALPPDCFSSWVIFIFLPLMLRLIPAVAIRDSSRAMYADHGRASSPTCPVWYWPDDQCQFSSRRHPPPWAWTAAISRFDSSVEVECRIAIACFLTFTDFGHRTVSQPVGASSLASRLTYECISLNGSCERCICHRLRPSRLAPIMPLLFRAR